MKYLLVQSCTHHVGYLTTPPEPVSEATLCIKHNKAVKGVHYIKITFFQGHWRHLAVPCISACFRDIYLAGTRVVFVLLPNHKVAFKNGPLLLADEVVGLDVQLPGAGNTRHLCSWGALGCSGRARGCLVGLECRRCHLGLQGLSVGSASQPTGACDLLGIALVGPGYVWHQQHQESCRNALLTPSSPAYWCAIPLIKPGCLGLLQVFVLEPHVLLKSCFSATTNLR